jgi:hypothetical protein
MKLVKWQYRTKDYRADKYGRPPPLVIPETAIPVSAEMKYYDRQGDKWVLSWWEQVE